ncbi:uncharacterized protein LOC122377702 isoform X1 [Amphibalanus amphitrite]|uniref:uncharacterized protein LOC122377702 isoform X1 n=1 Tax=Amphibalanus amphitrite TaxID=1232801 RepID=UPI001C90991F|nr:uncharacterized protein LOC122377702 isoform X1 [Amphibalanus amphitrite]XP_043213986.1 uncharacterized protein LOC122377702 isoform X1 [Amphibalanus amphitrite]
MAGAADDEEHAYRQQMRLVEQWRDRADTRFLRYGALSLSVLTAACGLAVSAHYRSALRLRSHGLLTSLAPVMAIPAASAGVSHHAFIVRDLLLFETACPVCLNVRAVGIQLGFSVLLPVVMGTISNFHLAEQKMTYALPPLAHDRRAWAAAWRRLSRPLARPLALLAALNAACAAFVTHREATEFYSLLEKHDREQRWKRLNADRGRPPAHPQ